MDTAVEKISELDPRACLQTFFLTAAATVSLVNSVPALRDRFVVYGPRASTLEQNANTSTLGKVLDRFASLKVPHAWFTHFYAVSVGLSLFWAIQISLRGRLYQAIADAQSRHTVDGSPTMTLHQIGLTTLLMGAQGSRRLYESITLAKPSSSQMWSVHWLLGILFYVAVSIAVWIEGIADLRAHGPSLELFAFTDPSVRSLLCVPLFLVASGIQYDCHTYLASLEKYTLPNHPIFQLLLCPHYTVECLIYLSIALVAAPEGRLVNRTLFTALIFVITNLAASAQTSQAWYIQKFGRDQVKERWKMIPFVF